MTRTTPDAPATSTLGAMLAQVHEPWAAQVRRVLGPATDPQASFWTRWGAARFLGDQFARRFRAECALMDELEGLIPSRAVARLEAARAEIDRAAAELRNVGRQRGVAQVMADLTTRFVEALAHWWAEAESATASLEETDLPPSARRRLTRLLAVDAVAS
jgi:hypothetical protein